MTSKAYIDGRDLRATPPLTLVRLNVWAGLPRRLNRVVGQINHGKRVRVMERRHCGFERREMARIRRWFLTGWVPATWLSHERRKAVGTLYEPAPLWRFTSEEENAKAEVKSMTRIAYIDGKDPGRDRGRHPEAILPVTLARLDVWGGLPRRCYGIVGQVEHGARVRVMERQHSVFEDRWFVHIRYWTLTGWIPEDWLSERREAVLGHLYEPAPLARRRKPFPIKRG